MERQGHTSDLNDRGTVGRSQATQAEQSESHSPLLLTPADALQAIQCVPDAVLFLSPSLQLLRWNRAAESLMQLSASDIEQLSWLKRFSAADQSRIQTLMENCRSVEASAIELSLAMPAAAPIDLKLQACSLDDSGSPVSLMLVSTDISHLKKSQREAEEAIRGRDQFLAMLSHELRNPLSAILNAYEILKSPASGKVATEEARHVAEGQLKHLTRLLDDLLDVSRVVNHRMSLKLAKVDMKTIIAEAVESVRHQFSEKRQRLVVNLPAHTMPVQADASRLLQAHVNLLVNASKYSPAGSTIQVMGETLGTQAVCHVIDSGPGIRESLRERIFEPFVQVDQTLDRAEGGMGIGLALVRLIAETHQGSIQVENNSSGTGSRFTLSLPKSSMDYQTSDQPEAAKTSPCKVLLIEDMADVRLMMVRALQLCGFEVLWAETGLSGIELLKNSRFDAAIVDIGLPDISGYEVARRVRQSPDLAQAFLIAVTGYGMPEDVDLAHDAGFNLHMLKPIHFPELVRVLERVHAESLGS